MSDMEQTEHKNSNPHITLHTKYYIVISKKKQKFVKYIKLVQELKKRRRLI